MSILSENKARRENRLMSATTGIRPTKSATIVLQTSPVADIGSRRIIVSTGVSST